MKNKKYKKYKKKYKLFTFLAILGALTFIAGLLCLFIEIELGILLIVVGLSVTVLFGLLSGTFETKFKKTCSECGEELQGCEYGYQEIKRNVNIKNGSLSFKIEINATCPHCGANKRIVQNFGAKPGENIEYKVDKYCKKLFGH